jgi:hypothetical protein
VVLQMIQEELEMEKEYKRLAVASKEAGAAVSSESKEDTSVSVVIGDLPPPPHPVFACVSSHYVHYHSCIVYCLLLHLLNCLLLYCLLLQVLVTSTE